MASNCTFPRLEKRESSGFFGAAWLAIACAVVLCGWSQTVVAAEEAAEPLPLELDPYRVSILVGFDHDAGFSSKSRQQILNQLRQRCRSYWGRMCETQIGQNPRLFPATTTTLERVELTPDAEEAQDQDKVFLLTVEADGAAYRVSGKVYDVIARETSPVMTAQSFRREDIADDLFATISGLFEPIIEIGDFDRETVKLTARAGEILPPDPDQLQLKPGGLLRPFYRFFSREGEVLRVQTIPWTYFAVTETDRARAKCRLSSGLRVPLTTRRRRTVKAMAVGIRPRFENSKLKLVAQSIEQQSLPGINVSILTGGDDDKPPKTLMSDRDGIVTISTSDAPELPMILAVRSGTSVLAKMPFVPGLAPETSVFLPDDSIRLKVEGQLAVLESEIIDVVAKIAVLKARTKFFMKKNDWEQIDEQLARVDELAQPNLLRTRLTVIRENAVQAAEARRNISAKRRIERVCRINGELIDRYLDPNKLKEFKEEVEETRKALQGEDEE